jgi:hypothetical protein
MSLRHNLVAALGLLASVPACNPYQNFDGEYFAGAVDATNFQEPYLGELPATSDQGGGIIIPHSATVNNAPTFYYLFPLAPAMTSLTVEDLPISNVYVFDPTATSAFPSPARCKGPENYVHDQRTEAYRMDEQNPIFELLPSSGSYIPIVQQVPVTSNGVTCQDPKSKAAVTSMRGDLTVGMPSGKYLAWALIDPTADVAPTLGNGLGPIHIGFFNHFLTVFIDGGYIPTVDIPDMGPDMPAHTDFRTQQLFVPNTAIAEEEDPMTGMITLVPVPNELGAGFDILEAGRGDAAYSPICEVVTYDPDLDADMLPVLKGSVADLTQAELATAMPTGELVYCFQVF